MREYQLNIEKSREVYETFKDFIKVKQCYNNVFTVFEYNPEPFRSGKWKIAYGYAEVMAALYCRHCFILDENDTVIDPTIFATDEPQTQREYYVMAVFEDMDEYLNAIENNDCMPALNKHFLAWDIKARQWATNNGKLFVG